MTKVDKSNYIHFESNQIPQSQSKSSSPNPFQDIIDQINKKYPNGIPREKKPVKKNNSPAMQAIIDKVNEKFPNGIPS